MITLTTEQAQQIEKSLSGWKEYDAWTDQQMWNNDDEKALVTIREARAHEQAEQKPVACIIHTEEGDYLDWNSKGYCFYTGETPLYAAPVRTKDLTDNEIESVYNEYLSNLELYLSNIKFARAVIQADREKNKCQH